MARSLHIKKGRGYRGGDSLDGWIELELASIPIAEANQILDQRDRDLNKTWNEAFK